VSSFAGLTVVRRVHIDTDPGLDDLLALAFALASPELEVCGLTSVAGNASLDATTDNARRFLAWAEVDLPLGRGAAGPLALATVHAEQIHGADGRRGLSLAEPGSAPLPPASAVLRASLTEHRIDRLIALGPLTNVAALLASEPELFAGVEVVWMGGALGAGNATPLAEFNAWADPRALAVLLDSPIDLRILPLDVTRHVVLRPGDLGRQPFGAGHRGLVLERILRALMEVERPFYGEPVAVLHDPCAIAAAISPDLFRYEHKTLEACDREGRERGRLTETGIPLGAGVHFAVESRTEEICRLFLSRLAGWSQKVED
jgi:inosine-uridine nucleoside N-ribohydrolase